MFSGPPYRHHRIRGCVRLSSVSGVAGRSCRPATSAKPLLRRGFRGRSGDIPGCTRKNGSVPKRDLRHEWERGPALHPVPVVGALCLRLCAVATLVAGQRPRRKRSRRRVAGAALCRTQAAAPVIPAASSLRHRAAPDTVRGGECDRGGRGFASATGRGRAGGADRGDGDHCNRPESADPPSIAIRGTYSTPLSGCASNGSPACKYSSSTA